MKFSKFLWIGFLSIALSGNAQDVYESLWNRDGITVSSIQKEVDSIISVYENQGEKLQSIRIAHEFSRKLFREKLFADAINYGQYEISLYRKLGVKNSKYAKALYNVGLFYYRLGNFEKSIPYYQEVVAINVDEYSTAKAFCELGLYYYTKGDFYRSSDYYSYGIATLEKLDKKKLLIKRYINHSHVLYEIETKKSLNKMLEVLDKADELLDLVPDYSPVDFNILNNDYALYYTTKERFDFEKVRYYCLRNLSKALKENDSTYIYASYTILGDVFTKIKSEKQKDSALFCFSNALKYTRNSKEKSIVYHNYSNYYLRNNEYKDALDNIQKSLIESTYLDQNIKALPKLNELTISDNKYNILLALIQKATILIKLYQKENNTEYIELALSNLLAADQLVDVLLDVSEEEGSRLYWRKEASEIYLKGVLVCGILNEEEKAFYFSEKKKALLLTEDIIQNIDKSELPDTVLELENDLKKQILDLENLISSNKNKDSIILLENARFSLKQQYQKQEDSLRILFPAYYKDQKATKIVDLKNFQKTLDENSIIISYIANQDEYYDSFSVVYATLISKTQTEIIRIGESSALEKLVRAYRAQLSKPFETEQDRLIFQETASELYALLIPKDKISMSLDQKHLIIIPDGTLQYIPFESLIVDRNTNRYLIEDNEISYAYSMSFLQHNATVKRSASQDLVSFAPISFIHDDLEDINNSSKEIDGITKSIAGDRYSNNEATKHNFLSNTDDYKIIHLATHANFSDNLQIAFYDTNLEYYELYTSRNQAELVVLSACNTLLGEIAEGEGVMSLARGFFHAGANTVISSLWNANDRSTAQIMESFYVNLENGQTKSNALHNAKISYLKSASLSDASPHYWATFMLIGDADTKLFPSNTLPYRVLFSLLLGLLITALVFFLKKKFFFG
ncbi:CHAT domain-containing tetratricopeptide repeat protein [uncultured Aquimarina sp.]|uniref:CHAT domain-containing protein n=1 Tax=uncultured Aquimarina sp. TaxID=575652 RepID=UPI0026231013|nr:CHAT domain-containing tetratricopeptide repeat protein [uncultured Aquimarina sp.]